MPRTLVVSGTDTGVGKTWVACELIRALRRTALTVAVRKPVESFEGGPPDSEQLAAASGEPPDRVCRPTWRFPVAMAPPMAAEALGRTSFSLTEVLRDCEPTDSDVLLVEGVGGPRSPLADDADTVALARALPADEVLVVSGSGLGSINHALLSTDAFKPLPARLFLNRFDEASDLHRRNAAWLRDRGFQVWTEVDALASHLVHELQSVPSSLEVR